MLTRLAVAVLAPPGADQIQPGPGTTTEVQRRRAMLTRLAVAVLAPPGADQMQSGPLATPAAAGGVAAATAASKQEALSRSASTPVAGLPGPRGPPKSITISMRPR